MWEVPFGKALASLANLELDGCRRIELQRSMLDGAEGLLKLTSLAVLDCPRVFKDFHRAAHAPALQSLRYAVTPPVPQRAARYAWRLPEEVGNAMTHMRHLTSLELSGFFCDDEIKITAGAAGPDGVEAAPVPRVRRPGIARAALPQLRRLALDGCGRVALPAAQVEAMAALEVSVCTPTHACWRFKHFVGRYTAALLITRLVRVSINTIRHARTHTHVRTHSIHKQELQISGDACSVAILPGAAAPLLRLRSLSLPPLGPPWREALWAAGRARAGGGHTFVLDAEEGELLDLAERLGRTAQAE